MDSVLAHAIPTPTMVNKSTYLLWITATDMRPIAPHSRQSVCVYLRPSRFAIPGNAKENTKHTAEYTAKQLPPHSTPAWYWGELVSLAPKTLCATAIGK